MVSRERKGRNKREERERERMADMNRNGPWEARGGTYGPGARSWVSPCMGFKGSL